MLTLYCPANRAIVVTYRHYLVVVVVKGAGSTTSCGTDWRGVVGFC